MVELRTFGRVELTDARGQEIRALLAQPKRLVLLAYLALSSRDGYRSRGTLCGLFWPELDEAHARNALSQACRFLRRNLGDDALLSRGNDELSLADGEVRCDAVTFDDSIARDDLDAASATYRGAFLDGVYVSDASADLEMWIEQQRERLRRAATDVEIRLAQRAQADGDRATAERHARAATTLSPDDERGQRELITVLAHSGERVAALKVYESFARRLAREYDAEPSMETRAAVGAARVEAVEVGATRAAKNASTGQPTSRRSGMARRPRSRLAVASASAMILVALLAVGAAWSATHSPMRSNLDANLVAVAPFDVMGTPNPDLREGILDLVSASLDGAGPLRAVPVSRVLKVWSGRADAGAAMALAHATHAGLVVYGRVVAAAGDSVRVMASLFDARVAGTQELEVSDDARRLDRLGDSITIGVLRDLGRTRPIGAVRAVALGSTSRLALRAFLRGEQFFRRNLADSATANYARAAELDPRFALAWRRLAAVRAWGRWETDSLIVLYRGRAASLNVGLPARESLLVVADSLYQALIEQARNVRWAEHHRRLHETLSSAAERYPDDPEIWYALGIARAYFPQGDDDIRRAFDAFDRALALDSAYLPAYEHPALLSLYIDRPDDAWRYLAARRRNDSAYASSEGGRLVARLIEPGLSASERDRLVARASPAALAAAAFALDLWRDPSETSVQLRRELLHRNRPAELGDRDAYVEALFARGHPIAALAAAQGHLEHMLPAALVHLALVGAVPGGVVEARIEQLQRAGQTTTSGLPLWAARRDTTAITQLLRTLDERRRPPVASHVSPESFRRARLYFMARASAYLSLGRGDSAEALRRFAALASPECSGCSFTALRIDRLTLARLLSAQRRDREALSLVASDYSFGINPGAYEVDVALETARLASRLGDRARAISAYTYVLRTWPHPDSAVLRFTDEARRALRR